MHTPLRSTAWRILLSLCLLGVTPAFAASAADTAAHPEPLDEAPLIVLNREITVFRAEFMGVSPKERARRTARVVSDLIARPGAGEVTIKDHEQGRLILIDGTMAIGLVSDDVDKIKYETLDATAQRAATALKLVVTEARESRQVQRLLRSAGEVALATIVMAAILLGLRRLRLAAQSRLVSLAQRHVERLELGGQKLFRTDRLFDLIRWALRILLWSLAALVIYEWASITLSRFPYTRPWGERLSQFLFDLIGLMVSGIANAVPNLAVALAIFFIARAVVRALDSFFERVATQQIALDWLDADLARPTRKLLAVSIWLFALAMAYPYLPGAQTDAFKGLSVLVGLMVSLGASSLVGQAASGLILMYSRTLRVGEYVRIGEAEGTVMAIGMFSTRIRTGMGEELAYSNSLIIGNVTRNYSRAVKGVGYIVDTVVTIGYDTPWRQVEAMLVAAAQRTPGILADPVPHVFQTALSDFYVEYRLVAQAVPATPRPRAEVLNVLHGHIQDVFNEFGVQIMSPNYRGDPAQEKIVPPERWYLAPARPPENDKAS